MKHVVAFACGLLFALGLGVSGMTRPDKVVGFLDFFGRWDPSLALVMIGAIGVNLVPTRLALRRERPVLDVRFHLATLRAVDARLVIGAALFGVGWGIGGYCPGPAVVSAAAGLAPALLFTATMLIGFRSYDVVAAAVARARAPRLALGDG